MRTVYDHLQLAKSTEERKKKLSELIRSGTVGLGGNKKLKIYGLLTCSSGKRMKVQNRVFFKDEREAVANGYRPCGHCMRDQYELWKTGDPSKVTGRKK